MRLSALLVFLLFSVFTYSQSHKYKIAFYNVENLFDTFDDSLKNDDEFTPYGDRHWTKERLNRKIQHIAKLILALGGWNPPSIIGLCEVENLYVLERLVNHPLLKHLNYQIIHKESPDHRGIDVALLYLKESFKPTFYNCIPIINEDSDTLQTREILHVTGITEMYGELHLFVNHWPSRYGGLMETEGKRKLAAKHLQTAINILLLKEENTKIICMGDFNDQPQDESLAKVLDAGSDINSNLINLFWNWKDTGTGTLKHQQNWNLFDQFIVCKKTYNLIDTTYIFKNDFLLEDDKKYTGKKPFRTYIGYKYNGGFSDHLPIVLELK